VEYGELCKSYDELKSQNAEMFNSYKEAGLVDLHNEIIQLKASLAHMEDQRDAAYKKHNELVGENDWYNAYTAIAKNASKWKEEYDQVKQENAELKDKVLSDENDWNDSLQRNIKLTEELRTVKLQVIDCRDAADKWQQRYNQELSEINSLQNELSKELDRRGDLMKENAELNRQISEYFNPDLRAERDTLNKENVELKRQLAAMTETVFEKQQFPIVDINPLNRYISVTTDPITTRTFTYDHLKENTQSVFMLIEIIRNAYEDRLGVIYSGEVIKDENDLP
jgi:chromosome segregation ATPase